MRNNIHMGAKAATEKLADICTSPTKNANIIHNTTGCLVWAMHLLHAQRHSKRFIASFLLHNGLLSRDCHWSSPRGEAEAGS